MVSGALELQVEYRLVASDSRKVAMPLERILIKK
jgi:hypothetical protein